VQGVNRQQPTSDHFNPRTMFCVVSHAANIVSALVTADMPCASFAESNKPYSFPIPLLVFLPTLLFPEYLPSHSLSKSFRYFTYYRHGFAVGSNALGGISTPSNFLYVLEQSTCVAANSIASATATATRIACYGTTR
jgi:hypothetical protein